MRSPAILAILLLLFMLLPLSHAAQDDDVRFYVYGSHSCSECERTLEVLESEFGRDSIVFYDLSDSRNIGYFNEIYREAFPGRIERIPLVGVYNGSLRAVVSGYHDADFWHEMLGTENGTALYYLDEYLGMERDMDRIERYDGLFMQSVEIESNADPYALIGMVVLAALADSINPCAFAVLIAFLTLISYRKGRREVLRAGIAFMLAVFVVYSLMGLGLIQLFSVAPWLKLLVGAAGMLFGTVEMLDSIKERKESSLLPERIKGRIKTLIRGISRPEGAFLMGIFVSIFLLPCTSGPYFIAMSLISGSSFWFGMALLILYNLIFIFPFFLITVLIWSSRMDTVQMKRWRERYGTYMGLIAGAIIFFLGMYLIFEYVY